MLGQRILFPLIATLLTLLLQLAAGVLGMAGVLFNLLVPVPAAYVGMRQGADRALGTVLLTAAALVVIGGWSGTAPYLLQFGLASWLLPLLLRRGWGWDRVIAAVTLAVAAAGFGALFAYSSLSSASVGGLVDRYVQEESERALTFYQQAEISGEQFEELQLLTQQMADFLLLAWPGLALVATAALLLLTLLLLRALARERYRFPGVSFREWKAPEPLVWVLIAAGGGILLSAGPIQRISVNLLVVILPVYFLQGLAIVQFFFWKKNTAPFLRHLGFVLIAILNPLPLIVTGMGVFDMWIDFRKPRIKKA